jgi:sialidase-1
MRTLLLLFLLGTSLGLTAEVPTLHPRAVALASDHQGPFVTAADGGVLCVDSKKVHRSVDEGRTWTSGALFADPALFSVSNERALLRTKEGVIIAGWMNLVERKPTKRWNWGEPSAKWTDFILPTYTCRSVDDGKTWEAPVKLSDPWCGCIHSLIQMKSGRLVLVGQEIIPQWRHATVMWVSDDLGQSWQRGDVLDYGVGTHDHAGSLEGTVVERADGSLYLLLRTEAGFLWEATSTDGLRWSGLKQTTIRAVTCCPQMARLSDGRIALLWNAPPRHDPKSGSSRAELSLAFSSDETATWSEPIIVAANYAPAGRVSYPYLYERRPGEFWITTMQGNLRMKVNNADLAAASIPVFVPPPKVVPKEGGIFMFGDSTTAPRGGVKVYSERVGSALEGVGSSLSVYNAGVPGNTTAQGIKRLKTDVLAYKPRVVVIQFGINDSAVDVWKTPPVTEPRVVLESYLSNIRAMVKQCGEAGSKVILMTTNPLRWSSKTRELYGKAPYDPSSETGFESAQLVHYNEALRALAKEMSVPLVDVHAAYAEFAKKRGTTIEAMLPDGMHPSDLGHELVAELLLPVVRKSLQ